MNQVTKEAERVRRPKLPKNRLLKKTKKRSKHARDGGEAERGLGNLKRGALFCPKCGSTNLFWASGLPHLWSIWECRNCGYRGAFIVRDGKLAQKIREDYAKKAVKP